jgi:hypothetical protein
MRGHQKSSSPSTSSLADKDVYAGLVFKNSTGTFLVTEVRKVMRDVICHVTYESDVDESYNNKFQWDKKYVKKLVDCNFLVW